MPNPAIDQPSHSTRLSLLKPTGQLTLGNYLGALRPMRESGSAGGRCFFGVCDLHALTVSHDPARLRARTAEMTRTMLAVGLDPDRQTLFVQSRVPTHVGLHYLLEAVATTGELGRMIQYKEKGRGQASTRAALFTYPVLMAADILLYDAAEVPVGADQNQHLELARDLATRFNHTYGDTFVVPRAVQPAVGARVMNLMHPSEKMGKSERAGAGILYLLDPPDLVAAKIKRAVTDSERSITYTPQRPGVQNLIDLTVGCSGLTVQQVLEQVVGAGDLKRLATEAVLSLLDPIRTAYQALDPREVAAVFGAGSEQALAASAPVLDRARKAIGL